jgi:hypothetical protein
MGLSRNNFRVSEYFTWTNLVHWPFGVPLKWEVKNGQCLCDYIVCKRIAISWYDVLYGFGFSKIDWVIGDCRETTFFCMVFIETQLEDQC